MANTIPGVKPVHRCRSQDEGSDLIRLLLLDQKVDRHGQRAGEFLLQFGRTFAPAGFDLGQVILADADCYGQFALNHVAPFADHAYRVIAVGEAIGHGFWQDDLPAFPEGARRMTDEPARGGILLHLSGKGNQPVIFIARKYSEITATWSADELNTAF